MTISPPSERQAGRTLASSRVDPGCQACGWRPPVGGLWPSEGSTAVDWIEDNCICGEGDFWGQPLRLRVDQQRFLYRWYEFCPECRQWRFNEGLRGAATGDGKTALLAAIAVLEMAGPPQIAVPSPNIPISAASFEQADLLFTAAATMCGGRDQSVKDAPLCGYFNVYDTEITFADGRPGRIFRVAAVAGTNEGGLPSLLICDELHEWGSPGSRKARVHTVIGKSTLKRRTPRGSGRILRISTAGFDVNDSLLGEEYKRGKTSLYDPGSAPRLLFDWQEAPEGLNFDDAADREVAVRAASGAADVLWSVRDRVNAWGQPSFPRHEWLRYFANTWVDIAEESWLKDHPGAWAACEGAWTSDPRNPFVIAVDMALKHDSVAVSRIEALPDGRFAITSRIWRPNSGPVDHLDVFNYIRSQARGLQFRGVVYDPRFFELPGRMLEDEGVLAIQFDQAQPLDEPVLTPTGWRPIGDLEVGDEVVGADGRPTCVVGVHDRGVLPVFDVLFTDGARTRCTGDHLWLTQSPSQRKNGSSGTVRSLDQIVAVGLRSRSGRASLRFVPTVSAVKHREAAVPLDPYLLGALLGDGSFTERSTPHLTSVDEGIVERVRHGLPAGVDLVRRQDGVHYALSSGAGWKPNPVTVALRELGLYGLVGDLKFIPEPYLYGSAEQRLALLQGLMDTDGTAQRGFGASFHTTAPGLRDGLIALVRSLGGVARASEKPVTGKMRRPAWIVTVGLPANLNPFGLPRKASLVDRRLPPHRAMADVAPVGDMDVRCITVENPDGLYVTSDYIVTHNSPQRMAPACGLAFDLILDQRIVHDGDPELGAHVKAAVKREQDRGFTLSKGKSKRHIDAVITLCMGVWILHGPVTQPPLAPSFVPSDDSSFVSAMDDIMTRGF